MYMLLQDERTGGIICQATHSYLSTSVLKSGTRKGNTIRVIEARRKLTRSTLVPV